jgi:hypothetical protein
MSILDDKERDPGTNELLIERILRAAGPRRELPPELAARWQTVLAAELANVARQRRQRTLAGVLAIAACVALAAIGVMKFPADIPRHIPPRATLTYVDGPVLDTAGATLVAGRSLAPGATLRTLESGFAGLSFAGADVRVAEDSVVELSASGLRLLRGRVYLDTGDAPPLAAPALVVTTRWGIVRHTGTQFMVASSDTGLSGAVRTGAIRLRTADASHDVRASPGRSAVLEVDTNGHISMSYESIANARWQWIGAAAPGYPIAGRTALEALEWAARESGRPLAFTSSGAKDRAQSFVVASAVDARIRTPEDVQAIVARLAGLHVSIAADETIRVAPGP